MIWTCSNNVLAFFYSKEYIWNNTYCEKILNKCIASVFFYSYLLPVMINDEWVFLFIGYMDAFWQDSNAIIYIVLSLFTDLNLDRIFGLPYLRIWTWRIPIKLYYLLLVTFNIYVVIYTLICIIFPIATIMNIVIKCCGI